MLTFKGKIDRCLKDVNKLTMIASGGGSETLVCLTCEKTYVYRYDKDRNVVTSTEEEGVPDQLKPKENS
jgi:hypothetical protein